MDGDRNDDVQDGELFPCSSMFGDDGNISDWYDLTSLLLLIFNIIGLVFEILVGIVFCGTVIKLRQQLRNEGKAGGGCCTDWLKSMFCVPCFLAQTMRSAGVTGKTYSLFAVDAELGLGSGATSTKDIPVALATAS